MANTGKPKGIFLLEERAFESIYGPLQRSEIASRVDLQGHATADQIGGELERLRDIELIFSGWGAPVMDEEFLAQAPALKAVFYGAGSVRQFVTGAFWQRNIALTSAYAANAVPVSEYTLATVLLSLKRLWHYSSYTRLHHAFPAQRELAGAYRSVVGLISLGAIGRLVRQRLRPFDLRVIAYDPYITAEQAADLDVTLTPLKDVFAHADVVSLHTPWLPETEGLIRGEHLVSMKPRGTFINTARGAVVNEQEMIAALRQRPDLQAILDVTYPEPPAPESPLYTLPNVVLTPHIAGSVGAECQRMGQHMVDELQRYLAGEALRWRIDERQAKTMA